tara:strand:+ start:527 stop:715 length:189 start_codon:yes stop_codon:yes gene_type:complete
MSDTVFIVSTGGNRDGFVVVGVYRSHDKAEAAAMVVETELGGGWLGAGGCAYVEVTSHVIEP